MIRIDRTHGEAPAALETDGQADLPRIKDLVDQGTLTSKDFDSDIYSSEAVRTSLWEMQDHKCCFCEREYERKWSTVEHFRPKTSANRENGVVDLGYWWLAYDYENLYFACNNCNSPKSNRFPLEAGTAALGEYEHPSTHAESPLVLDPGRDKPEDHLTFVWLLNRGYQITSRDGSTRGSTTIRIAALDRDDLTELRHSYYKRHIKPVVTRYRRAVKDEDEQRKSEALTDARRLTKRDHPYSLLAKEVFRQKGLL